MARCCQQRLQRHARSVFCRPSHSAEMLGRPSCRTQTRSEINAVIRDGRCRDCISFSPLQLSLELGQCTTQTGELYSTSKDRGSVFFFSGMDGDYSNSRRESAVSSSAWAVAQELAGVRHTNRCAGYAEMCASIYPHIWDDAGSPEIRVGLCGAGRVTSHNDHFTSHCTCTATNHSRCAHLNPAAQK